MRFVRPTSHIIPSLALVALGVLGVALAPTVARSSDDSVFSGYQRALEGEVDQESTSQAVLDLLEVLDQQTEVATRTRLNVDRVPGMVSVVHGRDLAARGARTVHEALAFVPGVQTAISGEGIRQVIIRGAGKVLRSGKTKILLNGVQANNTLSGEAVQVLALPIEQVDRIEVIRGPGSAVHGEFAYVGVVNVITRKNNDAVFARIDEYGGVTAGGSFAHNSESTGLRVTGNISGSWTDGPDVTAGPDSLIGGSDAGISNSPGPTNEKEDFASAFFTLDYKNTSLKLQYTNNRFGDFFGAGGALPEPKDRFASEHEWWNAALTQKFQLARNLSATLDLGFTEYAEDVDFQILPGGFSTGTSTFEDGLFFGFGYPEERRVFGAGRAAYTGFKRHTLSLEVSAARIQARDFFARANFDPATFEPTTGKVEFTGSENFLQEGRTNRRVISTVLQDEITLAEWLTVTVGGRYDDYSDVGSNFAPRIATVARFLDHHSVKAQYAEAFRPPTFLELSSQGFLFKGDPNLEPETTQTWELAYIYNSGSTVARATLFYSTLEDSIGRGSGSFRNQTDQSLRGAEIDFEQDLTRILKVRGALGFVDTEDDLTGEQFPDVAAWSGNLGLYATPWPDRRVSFDYRFLGKRMRGAGDSREAIDPEHVFDLTFTASRIFGSGVGLRFGIRNLFDQDVVSPATSGTYANDYQRPGREFWGGMSHDF